MNGSYLIAYRCSDNVREDLLWTVHSWEKGTPARSMTCGPMNGS